MDSTTGYDGSFWRYTQSCTGCAWVPHVVRTVWDAQDRKVLLLFAFMVALASLVGRMPRP
jgi:hypothetical protein